MAAEDYLPGGWEIDYPSPGSSRDQSNRERAMSYQHKLNRGGLFPNDRKTRTAQPDMTGSIDVDGTIYWISAWDNYTRGGRKMLGLAVTRQEERQAQVSPPRPARKRVKARKGKGRTR